MEELGKQVTSVVTTPKKKVVPATKKTSNKDAEAMAKVQDLLKNTSVASLVGATTPEKPTFDVEEIKQEKSVKWMDGQIDQLSKQVEELENEIVWYKDEMKKLQETSQSNNSQPVGDNVLSPNLIALFKHFENVYESGYTDARIAHPESGEGVLDKIIQYFPQLQNVRRYRYRGPAR